MTNKITLKTKFETLNTLEDKGKWIGIKYRSIVNSDRKAITEFDAIGSTAGINQMENPDKPQLVLWQGFVNVASPTLTVEDGQKL